MEVFPAALGSLALLTALSLIVAGLAVRRELRRMADEARATAAEAFAHLDVRLAASEAEGRQLRERLSELQAAVMDDDRRLVEELASLSRIARLAS